MHSQHQCVTLTAKQVGIFFGFSFGFSFLRAKYFPFIVATAWQPWFRDMSNWRQILVLDVNTVSLRCLRKI